MSESAQQSVVSEWFDAAGKKHQIKADMDNESGLWTVVHSEVLDDGALNIQSTAAALSAEDMNKAMRTIRELASNTVTD